MYAALLLAASALATPIQVEIPQTPMGAVTAERPHRETPEEAGTYSTQGGTPLTLVASVAHLAKTVTTGTMGSIFPEGSANDGERRAEASRRGRGD